MPDVDRSDSQRSADALRPRVSFNRDVHVKRIVPRQSAANEKGDGFSGAPIAASTPYRKGRLSKSRQELAEEAAKVLNQVDSVDCYTLNYGEKFHSLPTRGKKKRWDNNKRRNSDELNVTDTPPKKPPRSFANQPKSASNSRNSIFNIFKKNEQQEAIAQHLPKKSNLRRSVSDATNLKSNASVFDARDNNAKIKSNNRKRNSSESEDVTAQATKTKKNLSPIIETTQREDYFDAAKENDENKENVDARQSDNVTQQIKDLIEEIDQELGKEAAGKSRKTRNKKKPPEIVVIDVDKAEKIASSKKSFGDKFKFLQRDKKHKATGKESPAPANDKKPSTVKDAGSGEKPKEEDRATGSPTSDVRKTIDTFENPSHRQTCDDMMMHSSQKPAEKPPLTKGYAVDRMVKRLSYDDNTSSSPPPKPNVLVTPNVSVQHNNNQPFSYTRGLSPEHETKTPRNVHSPVIYAQVVCEQNGSGGKQTVHAAYANGKKHLPHSDSDEGLGYEENTAFIAQTTPPVATNARKYEPERNNLKNIIRFGDEPDGYRRAANHDDDFFNDNYPITPKLFKKVEYNGFKSYDDHHRVYVDSSSRGRGDGMDAKRRESLTEHFDNLHVRPQYPLSNSRTDLSARRDQLESRLLSRRYGDKSPVNASREVTTTTYYRSGSASPRGFRERRATETRIDDANDGKAYATESRGRKYFGDDAGDYRRHYNRCVPIDEPKSFDSQLSDYRSSPENEYRTPTTATPSYHQQRHHQQYKTKIVKDKGRYKSNPEIATTPHGDCDDDEEPYETDDCRQQRNAYHGSLRRDKDKFGDSGIENDFRRDSGDNYLSHRPKTHQQQQQQHYRQEHHQNSRQYQREFVSNNESEDEGFASSLLIASERQHTDDNINGRKYRRDYYEYENNDRNKSYHNNNLSSTDKEYSSNRHVDQGENYHKRYRTKDRSNEYAPRERSIDDGSHFDPRIDKDFDGKGTLKRATMTVGDRKPPKPEKKSGLEKVKQLFSRESKKNKKEKKAANNPGMVTEEVLRSRYTEYKGGGSRENLLTNARYGNSKRNEQIDSDTNFNYSNRRRLSTPSPSPSRGDRSRNNNTSNTNAKPTQSNGSWFKSLDRLSRKKSKKEEKYVAHTSTEEESSSPMIAVKSSTKNLRFFGDTDLESNDDSVRHKANGNAKLRTPLINSKERNRSQSTRDLHNIREERSPDVDVPRRNHKSMLNISEADRDELKASSRLSLKPPMSPLHNGADNRSRGSSKTKEDRNSRRRKGEVSSVESSTEGDGSQQSQRSVVYLHAPTVGDIPGPANLRNGRRAASREELASNTSSSRIQPQAKTLSRSFSVLAPWRPKHYKESLDIDYTQYQKPVKNGKYEQKPSRNGSSRKESTSTLKKKAQETRRSNQNVSTLSRKSHSKDNVSSSSQTLRRSSKENKGSSSTLYKKKEKQPKENTRYSSSKDDNKKFAKSMSVESLGGHTRRRSNEENREISRSISMPRDPEKSAGWFRINKKTKTK